MKTCLECKWFEIRPPKIVRDHIVAENMKCGCYFNYWNMDDFNYIWNEDDFLFVIREHVKGCMSLEPREDKE